MQELENSDAKVECILPHIQKPIETLQEIVLTDDSVPNRELNGGACDAVAFDPEAVRLPTSTNAENMENNIKAQPIIVSTQEETCTDQLSDVEVSCKPPKENNCLDEEVVSELN